MKNPVWLWQLAGVTFTAIFGSLLHFLFHLSGSIFVAPFSAVNESTWEHMKILFFPMLIFAHFQSKFFTRAYANFWQVKTLGIITGTLSIPFLFYTFYGVFGNSPAFVNVLIFFLSAGLSFLLESFLFSEKKENKILEILSKILLVVFTSACIIFTFFPPQIPLFLDPITRSYGIV